MSKTHDFEIFQETINHCRWKKINKSISILQKKIRTCKDLNLIV